MLGSYVEDSLLQVEIARSKLITPDLDSGGIFDNKQADFFQVPDARYDEHAYKVAQSEILRYKGEL